jgi:quinol monooxygenase YgiN
MIAISVRVKVRPGHEGVAAELFERMVRQASTETGLICYAVVQSSAEPREFVIYEQYADDAAQLAHRESAGFKALQPQLAQLLDGRPEAVSGRVVSAVSR